MLSAKEHTTALERVGGIYCLWARVSDRHENPASHLFPEIVFADVAVERSAQDLGGRR
jgi:hypothetical protein